MARRHSAWPACRQPGRYCPGSGLHNGGAAQQFSAPELHQTLGVIDPFEGQNEAELLNTLVDLTTGRQITLPSQLRPGYERPLRHLLSQHLRHEANPDPSQAQAWRADQNQPIILVSLPNAYEGFALTAQGLEATYAHPSLYSGGGDSRPVHRVLIPYLVRPGTLLARLLRARGL